MTEYPALKRAHSPWKKAKQQRRWQEVISVLVVVVLIILIVGGLAKTFSFKTDLTSAWDGESSLAVAINSSPGAIVVYGKTPAKIGVFEAAGDLRYATGDAREPVASVGSVFDLPGEKATGVLTNLTGVNVNKFVYFGNAFNIEGDGVYQLFKNFSSVSTPIALVFDRTGYIKSTNMSKLELLKLWWKVKGLSIKQVQAKSLGEFSDEIIGFGNTKFKGIDRESIYGELLKYFASEDKNKRVDVEIVNDSGAAAAGKLATSMISAYGFNVSGVSVTDSLGENCKVSAKRGAEASSLARSLGCDIVWRQDSQENDHLVIFLGSEFAKRYF